MAERSLDPLVPVSRSKEIASPAVAAGSDAATPGVTFNIVQPGAIHTNRNRAVLAQPGREEEVLARIPLGRLGANSVFHLTLSRPRYQGELAGPGILDLEATIASVTAYDQSLANHRIHQYLIGLSTNTTLFGIVNE